MNFHRHSRHMPPPPSPSPFRVAGILQGCFAARPAWPAGAVHARRPGAPVGALQAKAPVDLPGGGWASAVPQGFALPSAGGQALPDGVRQRMESFFGADFSDVRVHVGSHASSIGAVAFTIGSSLHFAPGQYQPDSPRGLQLLGHELAHVVQQRAGRVRNPFGGGIAVVQDTALEAEADRLGNLAAFRAIPGVPSRR